MDTADRAARVLVLGLDPRRVEGPWDPEPVVRAIEEGRAECAAHGLLVEYCLVGLDGSDDVPAAITGAVRSRPWECVVVGGGIRHDDALFEQVLNLVHAHAPDAAIALSGGPTEVYDAVARHLDVPRP